jgi:DNA ligase D-like protein (predicted 3'-phosphoesterase)
MAPDLDSYRAKRDFRTTGEPEGRARADSSGGPVFVVQEHDATTHHFDVRLEIEGVLVSWAVPKGPSTDPRDKRLAVRTEDHPLDYEDFEGVIPEGQYGAGPVIVWDRGPYRNLREEEDGDGLDMSESLSHGKIEVWLEGEKLRGGWAFVHAKPGGDEDAWLLVKMADEEADARRNPVSTEPESVLSGRTLEEVEADERADGEDGAKGGPE